MCGFDAVNHLRRDVQQYRNKYEYIQRDVCQGDLDHQIHLHVEYDVNHENYEKYIREYQYQKVFGADVAVERLDLPVRSVHLGQNVPNNRKRDVAVFGGD